MLHHHSGARLSGFELHSTACKSRTSLYECRETSVTHITVTVSCTNTVKQALALILTLCRTMMSFSLSVCPVIGQSMLLFLMSLSTHSSVTTSPL